MSLDSLLERWQADQSIRENIVFWEKTPARPAVKCPFPAEISPSLQHVLRSQGIPQLYQHQANAYKLINNGENLLITSGTASGKSLCYNLPVINDLIQHPNNCAFYLFPTKALAHDQALKLKELLHFIPEFNRKHPQESDALIGMYDGDTPPTQRQFIRQNAQLIFTNPDMLHFGILPNHPQWDRVLSNLRFIIIDEIHVYRGVFGSHIANVIRRLKRLIEYYGGNVNFILTSGTISNPYAFATKLIEEPITLLDEDASPKGEKNLIFYNPPIIQAEFGLRAHPFREAKKLMDDLLKNCSQSIVFCTSHRSVERLLIELRQVYDSELEGSFSQIQGYRSSYLPEHRRQIEQDLKSNKIKTVVATNALELGIDIGELEAVLLIGFPGSIASTWQQISRAGRKNQTSLGILILTSDPLDQYLARNPQYFLESSPEQPLINPDNPLILLNHLRCAMAELPFQEHENFGKANQPLVEALFTAILNYKEAIYETGSYYYISPTAPQNFSLRSSSFSNIQLIVEHENSLNRIGYIDRNSADRLVHPGAIYLHEGETYRVMELDLDNNTAKLSPTNVEYLTNPHQESTIDDLTALSTRHFRYSEGESFRLGYGDVTVNMQVTGYSKVDWDSHQVIERIPLALPPQTLATKAFWISIGEQLVNDLRSQGLWSAEPNKYGTGWEHQKNLARARDGYRCQICEVPETDHAHDVHHKIPFRLFEDSEEANRLENLITLCRNCHQKVESNLRIQSGLAGLGYALSHIAPLFVMCDRNDLGLHVDPNSRWENRLPTILIYENIAGGIGLSQRIFEIALELLHSVYHHIAQCPCPDGCPSCTGAVSENGISGKAEALILLEKIINYEQPF